MEQIAFWERSSDGNESGHEDGNHNYDGEQATHSHKRRSWWVWISITAPPAGNKRSVDRDTNLLGQNYGKHFDESFGWQRITRGG